MAITVNGQILRNLPEQVSKNTEDILELQDVSNNYGIRITALEGNAIALATFQDCTFTGTTSFEGPISSNSGFTFSGNGTVGGNFLVSGSSAFTGNVNIAGNLSVTGEINGEPNPSVKPLYYHPIYIYKSGVIACSCVIINNSPVPFTALAFNSLMTGGFSLQPISGALYTGGMKIELCRLAFYGTSVYAYGEDIVSSSIIHSLEISSDWNTLITALDEFRDDVNKIN